MVRYPDGCAPATGTIYTMACISSVGTRKRSCFLFPRSPSSEQIRFIAASGWSSMQINTQQEYAMTPENSVPWSGDLSDLAELLRALAAVADWASFCEKLQRELRRLLPSTRLDIYATSVDGTAQLRFT